MKMQNCFRKVVSVMIVMVLLLSFMVPVASAASKTLTIGSVNISKFTIVYPTSDYYSMSVKHPDTFAYGEWDFGRLIAERLQSEIQTLTGHTLPLAQASSSSAYQIKITTNGDSGRTGAYSVKGSGTTLTLYGDSYGAAWHSIDYLLNYINSKGATVELGSLSLSGNHRMYMISCYGDSLTAGCTGWEDGQYVGYPRKNRSSYPSILGRLLWKDAVVLNYGLNSVSVSTAGQAAFYGHNTAKNWEPMLEQAPNMDLTIIMLGTNDLWGWNGPTTDAVKKQYLSDYTNIVNSILAKQPDMDFLIANTPALNPKKTNATLTTSISEVSALQKQMVDTLNSRGVDAAYVDVYSYTLANCPTTDFNDTCHFTNSGYGKLATYFQDAVLDFNPNLSATDTSGTVVPTPSVPSTPTAGREWTINMNWEDSTDVSPNGTAITVYNRYPELEYANDSDWTDFQDQTLNFTRGSVSSSTYRSPNTSGHWDVSGAEASAETPVWIAKEEGYQISVKSYDEATLTVELTVTYTGSSSDDSGDTDTDTPNAIVISGADMQGGEYEMQGNVLAEILDQIKADYPHVDQLLFAGDLTQSVEIAADSEFGVQVLQNKMAERWPGIFQSTTDGTKDNILTISGNHDPAGFPLCDTTGGYDMGDYYVYLINHEDFPSRKPAEQTAELIAADKAIIQQTAADLDAYLDDLAAKGETSKPIFVLNHLPLHLSTRQDNRYAKYLVDVLNEAGAKGLDIIFMFGHNHSKGYDTHIGGSCIFYTPGDSIQVGDPSAKWGTSDFTTEKLNFTYMTAGYVGYTNTSEDKVSPTATVFEIYDDHVEIIRYNKDGIWYLKNIGEENSSYTFAGQVIDGTETNSPVKLDLVTGATTGGDGDVSGDSGDAGNTDTPVQPSTPSVPTTPVNPDFAGSCAIDITAVFKNGAVGEVSFTFPCPDWFGWDAKYKNQVLTFTPENNVQTLYVPKKDLSWMFGSDYTSYWTVTNPNGYAITPSFITKGNSSSDTDTRGAAQFTITGSGEVTNIPVTGVSVDKAAANLIVGETVTLTATVNPANATNKSVTWKTSDASVATVNNGVITAVGAGSATITVTTVDGSFAATCTVTVTAPVADDEEPSIPEEEPSIPEEEPTVIVGNSMTKDEAQAIVKSAGGAFITYNVSIVNKTGAEFVRNLTFYYIPSSSSWPAALFSENQTLTFTSASDTAVYYAQGYIAGYLKTGGWGGKWVTNATDLGYTVTYASTNDKTNLSGTVTITVSGTANVQPETPVISVTGVTLDKTAANLTVGDTATLIATVNPSNAANKAVTWKTSNAAVATVNNGVITAVGAGTATITVTTEDGSFTATCIVTVSEPVISVTGVTLDKTAADLTVGEIANLIATVNPSDAANKAVTWKTSNASVATVNNGVITAVGAGTATITVTTADGSFTANCIVTVAEPVISVTGVTLDKTAADLTVGDTATLIATVNPSNATNKNVTWKTSNASVATVNNGVITAVGAGTTTITVTTEDGSFTATCVVTVAEPVISVTGVTLDKTAADLTVGETVNLIATVNPSNAANKNVTWKTSNASVATVNNGVITAVGAGTATITVTTEDGSFTATCVVTVAEPVISVNGVTLDNTAADLTVGETVTLTATVNPFNATNKNVTWKTSNASVATVNNGVITAVGAGTATITVTTEDGSFTATCIVAVEEDVVVDVPVTGVTLDKTTADLTVGETVTLTATVNPSDAANKNVTWTTSNAAVATVNNGVITAVGAGTATITVTTEDGSFTATCIVTVAEPVISVNGVTLDKTAADLIVGESATLTATVNPSNATNKNVTWKTSNASVATVNNGVITAVGAGTATITVTTEDGSFTATCIVTVSEPVISVNGVTLDKTAADLTVGEIANLIATVNPSNATNSNVSWTTSDASVVLVNNGVISAVGAGTATITVTTEDGGFTATCTVTVMEIVDDEEESFVANTMSEEDAKALAGKVFNIYQVTIVNKTTDADIVDKLTFWFAPPSGWPAALYGENQKITFASVNDVVPFYAHQMVKGYLKTGGWGGKWHSNAAELGYSFTVTAADNITGGYAAPFTSSLVITITGTGISTGTPTIVPVNGVTLNQTSADLTVGETATLIATVNPSNATNKNVTWKTSNASVVTVNNGVITAVGAGTATITVTTANGGYIATCTVTVTAAAPDEEESGNTGDNTGDNTGSTEDDSTGETTGTVGNSMTKEEAQAIVKKIGGAFVKYDVTIVNNTGADFVEDLYFYYIPSESSWPSELFSENQTLTFSSASDTAEYYAQGFIAGYLKTGGWGGKWVTNATDLGYTVKIAATNDKTNAGGTVTITISGTAK